MENKALPVNALINSLVLKERDEKGGLRIKLEGSSEFREVSYPYSENYPPDGKYFVQQKSIKYLTGTSRTTAVKILFELHKEQSRKRIKKEVYYLLDKADILEIITAGEEVRGGYRINRKDEGDNVQPLCCWHENSGKESTIGYPYWDNFPKDGKCYISDRNIKKYFLGRCIVPIDFVFERAGINRGFKTIRGKRCHLVNLEELNRAREMSKEILKERSIIEKEEREMNLKRSIGIEKVKLEDILKESDLRLDNVEVYRALKELSKRYELGLPKNLSIKSLVPEPFADALKKEIIKNSFKEVVVPINIPFGIIQEIEDLKNEDMGDIVLKTGQKQEVISSVMERLGYKSPLINDKAGRDIGSLTGDKYLRYNRIKQAEAVRRFEKGYLAVLDDLLLFASDLPFPGLIGHVALKDYREAIRYLKKREGHKKVNGYGSIKIEKKSKSPYSKAVVTILNEVKFRIVVHGERKEFLPSRSIAINFKRLEEL